MYVNLIKLLNMIKKENYFFSIIIPTLNESKYISGLLDDLLNQEYRQFEVIVVDGRSVDNTKKIIYSYNTKIPFLKVVDSYKRNVSFQRNLGVNTSKGEYLVFIDADSRIGKNLLKDLNNNLQKDTPDTFSCWFNSVNNKLSFRLFCLIISFSYWLLYKIRLPSTPGCLLGIKKKVFIQMKGFSEVMEFAEDRDLIRRCCRKNYSFHFYFNPKYFMSLRRIEKIGLIKYLYVFVLINIKRGLRLKIDLNKEYPMGGGFYRR
jgi:glycosyltransferase involved in cell wall biosynthesis